MAITPKFTQADLKKAMDKVALNLHNDIVRRLAYIGEQLVTMSKKAMNIDQSAFPKGDYTDQSKNLRNSIAYVVAYNGKVQKSFTGPQTRAEAKSLLTQLVSEHNTGYALIVVAGMEYAVSVESKGYNVISSSEKAAGPLMEKMLRDLKINLK